MFTCTITVGIKVRANNLVIVEITSLTLLATLNKLRVLGDLALNGFHSTLDFLAHGRLMVITTVDITSGVNSGASGIGATAVGVVASGTEIIGPRIAVVLRRAGRTNVAVMVLGRTKGVGIGRTVAGVGGRPILVLAVGTPTDRVGCAMAVSVRRTICTAGGVHVVVAVAVGVGCTKVAGTGGESTRAGTRRPRSTGCIIIGAASTRVLVTSGVVELITTRIVAVTATSIVAELVVTGVVTELVAAGIVVKVSAAGVVVELVVTGIVTESFRIVVRHV